MKSRAFWMGALGGVVASLLIGLFAVPALGVFEMTATGPPGFLDWWGDTNWHNSLQWRATDAEIPASAAASEGLAHYRSSCLICHGAPGVPREEWAHEMQPMPPKLWEEETQQFSDGELFHIVYEGVRMTGMPAFGPKHSKADIWNVVAFVRELDRLTEEQKRQLSEPGEGIPSGHTHGSGAGSAPHSQQSGTHGPANDRPVREAARTPRTR